MTTLEETPTLRGLTEVRVSKESLIEIVTKNRDEHRTIFEEAIDGWHKAVIKALEEAVSDAKAGKEYRIHFGLTKPEDHTDEYNQVIRMLELSLDDELELTSHEFAQYVMDEWGWQRSFAASSMPYSDTANRKFGK